MNNFELPMQIYDIISNDTLSLHQKVDAVRLCSVHTMDMQARTLLAPIITDEQSEIIIDAIRRDLFSKPGVTSMTIECNRCGRIDTHIDEDMELELTEDMDAETVIKATRAYFQNKEGWGSSHTYDDLCPTCKTEWGTT